VKGDPRWRHRRRLVYLTALLSTGMIVLGMFVVTSEMVAAEALRNGTILLGAILSGYVFAATWDDKGRADYVESDFPRPADES
jgi:Na+-translocating ferredoxin:NAD+ oxidoreductase RnfD subunit